MFVGKFEQIEITEGIDFSFKKFFKAIFFAFLRGFSAIGRRGRRPRRPALFLHIFRAGKNPALLKCDKSSLFILF